MRIFDAVIKTCDIFFINRKSSSSLLLLLFRVMYHMLYKVMDGSRTKLDIITQYQRHDSQKKLLMSQHLLLLMLFKSLLYSKMHQFLPQKLQHLEWVSRQSLRLIWEGVNYINPYLYHFQCPNGGSGSFCCINGAETEDCGISDQDQEQVYEIIEYIDIPIDIENLRDYLPPSGDAKKKRQTPIRRQVRKVYRRFVRKH